MGWCQDSRGYQDDGRRAGVSAGSATLKIMGRDKDALFVGQWAPTFLLLGTYNKIVKVLGSD